MAMTEYVPSPQFKVAQDAALAPGLTDADRQYLILNLTGALMANGRRVLITDTQVSIELKGDSE